MPNMRSAVAGAALWLVLVALLASGCGSGPVHHVRSDVDFSFIRTAAVVPFRNLSSDRAGDLRMYSVFMAELLQYEGLQIVDPGEVLKAYGELRLAPDRDLSPEQIVGLGERLGVDAVFFGSVEEFGLERLGGNQNYMVTAVFGMAETHTGAVIWNVQVHTDGSSFWQKLFGGQPTSLYDVSRQAVREALDTLLDSGGGGDDRGERRRNEDNSR